MISKKRLRYLINDEKRSAAYYRKHGLPNIARDESKHRRILMRKLRRL